MGVSPLHEAIVDVARSSPASLWDLLGLCDIDYDGHHLASAGPLPENANRDFPRERRIDYVGKLRFTDTSALVVSVEVHLRNKQNPETLVARARPKWAADVAVLYEEHRCDVLMLIISDYDEVATEARQPIRLGPRSVTTPCAIGPSQIPKITDPADPRASIPTFAMLSAIFHGNGTDANAVLGTLVKALDVDTIDQADAAHRLEVVLTTLTTESAQMLEAIMTAAAPKYRSAFTDVFERRGEARGEARGELRAKLDTTRAHLRLILDRLNIAVTSADIQRIETCDDPDQLEAWIERSFSVKTSADLFGDGQT